MNWVELIMVACSLLRFTKDEFTGFNFILRKAIREVYKSSQIFPESFSVCCALALFLVC